MLYFDLRCCLSSSIFVVAIYSFACLAGSCLHCGLHQAPIYRVYTTYVCFTENVIGTVPQNLLHSSHLLGDFDRTENEVPDLRVFCKNDKVSTHSAILIEPRMKFLSLEFFCRNDKVSTCSMILKIGRASCRERV